ncbi:single-stranded DNA-binding protein [Vibrio astriarenae]
MLKIEIFPENETVDVRTIPAKEDKPSRKIFEQIAYAYLGGKFPVEMKISLNQGDEAYPQGIYTVDQSSYLVNNFGGIELKRYGLKLIPMN